MDVTCELLQALTDVQEALRLQELHQKRIRPRCICHMPYAICQMPCRIDTRADIHRHAC